MSSSLFYQAATLMLVGMGFVYAFLSLLIVVIRLAITPLSKWFPDEPVELPANRQPTPPSASSDSAPVIAAITSAVAQYRTAKQFHSSNEQS